MNLAGHATALGGAGAGHAAALGGRGQAGRFCGRAASGGGVAWRVQGRVSSGGGAEARGWAAEAGGVQWSAVVEAIRKRSNQCVVKQNHMGQKGLFTLQIHENEKKEKMGNTPNGSTIKWLMFGVLFLG